VSNRLIFLYAASPYKSKPDIEWAKRSVQSWRDAILKANAPVLAEDVETKIGRNNAVEQVQRDAISSGSPTGFFGLNWLISYNEAKRLVPDAISEADTLTMKRSFYDRNAVITVKFKNAMLVMFIVTFDGPASKADFSNTQQRLSNDYKSMPESIGAKEHLLVSAKVAGRFSIDHWLTQYGGINLEQILFYRNDAK